MIASLCFPGKTPLTRLSSCKSEFIRLLGELPKRYQEKLLGEAKLSLEKGKGEGLESRYKKKICKQGLDLMKRLLALDEKERLSAADALRHPFFSELLLQDKQLVGLLKTEQKENEPPQ